MSQSSTQPADGWIRQLTGNTGAVTYEEAMAGLSRIEANLGAGLFPTTGGEASLLKRSDVETFFTANRGMFPKFRPVVPDAPGTRPRSLGDWYVAAIEQALFSKKGPTAVPFSVHFVGAMDGFLHSYLESDVDWRRIHTYATKVHGSVPRIGETPYWLTDGSGPLTVLAFCDDATRAVAPKPY